MAIEQIGLEAILQDEKFQAGLKRYMDGLGQMTKGTQNTSNVLGQLGKVAEGALTAGMGAAIAAFGGMTAAAKVGLDSLTDWSSGISNLQRLLGGSAEQMSVWSVALRRSGLSAEDSKEGMIALTQQLAEVEKASKSGASVSNNFTSSLSKLGVSAIDSSGNLKTFDQLMPQIMDAFQKLPSGIEASSIAMGLFGEEAGSRFIQFLRQGTQGLKEATDMARLFGLQISSQGMMAVEQYNRSLDILGMAFTGLKNQIGMAVLPIAQDFITSMSGVAAGISQVFQSQEVKNGITNFGRWLTDSLSSISAGALDWGINITSMLASGMAEGMNTLADVLVAIGDMIAYFLAPGSPPRIAPELDQWGTDASNIYMQAWSQADFGVFDTISKEIQDQLNADAILGKIDQVDVIPTLLGSRSMVAAALDELKRTGDISQESFSKVVASAGPAGDQIRGMLQAYIDLQKANDAVTASQDKLAAAEEDVRLAREGLGDLKLGDMGYWEAYTSLRAAEAKRDQAKAEVEAAKKSAAATDDRVKSQQSLSNVQQQNADLIKQQIDLIERLNKKEKEKEKEKEKKSGGAAEIESLVKGLSMPSIPSMSGEMDKIKNSANSIKNAFDRLKDPFEKVGVAFSKLSAAAEDTFGIISKAMQPFVDSIVKLAQDHMTAIEGAIKAVAAVLAGAGIVSILSGIGAAIAAISAPLTLVVAAAALFGAAWAENWGGIRDVLTDFWEQTAKPTLIDLHNWLKINLPVAIREISNFWTNVFVPALQTAWTFIQTKAIPALVTLWDWLSTNIPAAILSFSNFVTNTLVPTINHIVGGVSSAISSIKNFFPNLFETWKENFGMLTTIVGQAWANITSSVNEKAINTASVITGFLPDILKTWKVNWDMFDTIAYRALSNIARFISSALDGLLIAMGIAPEEMRERWDDIWSNIDLIVSTVCTRVVAAVDSAITQVTTNVIMGGVAIYADLVDVLTDVYNEWAVMWTAITATVQNVWDAIVSKIAISLQDLFALVSNWLFSTFVWWSIKWNEFIMPLALAWENIWQIVSTKTQEIYDAISSKIEELRLWWETKWNEFTATLSVILAAVVTVATDKALEIYNAITSKIQEIIIWGQTKIQDFFKLGIALLDGLLRGALQKAGEVINAITGSIEEVIVEVKKRLGIASPSTVFNGIGKDMMARLGDGVQKTITKVTDVFNDLVPSAQSVAGSISGVFGLAIQQATVWISELNRVIGGESGTIDDLKVVQKISAGAVETIGEKLQAAFFIVRDGAAEAGSAVGGVWNGLNDIKNMNGLTTTITIITRHIDVYKGSVDGDGGGSGGGGGTPSPTPTATCFGSGTLVTMDDMTCKPIENVVVGDHVLSLDTGTGIKYSARVCDVFYHPMFEAQSYLIINGTLNVTPEHLLFVDGKWKRAGDMRAGDHMTGLDGEPMTVMCIHHIGASIPVYNLHTSHETHNYFANGVLAHNAKAYQHGGYVPSTGMAFLHAGEAVLSPKMVMGMLNVLSGLGSVASQTTINRVTNISVNPTYEQYASPATVYQDVAAALVAARM